MKKLNKLILLLTIIFATSCKNVNENKNTISKTKKQQTTNDVATKIDSTKLLLQEGCIVLRTGNDAISSLFAQLNKTDKTFSHCGIAFKENDKWFVFHSIGGEDNPDEKLRKEPFESFVGESHNKGYGICKYPINENQLTTLKSTVMEWYHKETPFDMEFDLKSDNRLYCAEMVFKAYNKACSTDSFFNTTFHNGFRYVSTDNIFVNKDAQMLCHIVY